MSIFESAWLMDVLCFFKAARAAAGLFTKALRHTVKADAGTDSDTAPMPVRARACASVSIVDRNSVALLS